MTNLVSFQNDFTNKKNNYKNDIQVFQKAVSFYIFLALINSVFLFLFISYAQLGKITAFYGTIVIIFIISLKNTLTNLKRNLKDVIKITSICLLILICFFSFILIKHSFFYANSKNSEYDMFYILVELKDNFIIISLIVAYMIVINYIIILLLFPQTSNFSIKNEGWEGSYILKVLRKIFYQQDSELLLQEIEESKLKYNSSNNICF